MVTSPFGKKGTTLRGHPPRVSIQPHQVLLGMSPPSRFNCNPSFRGFGVGHILLVGAHDIHGLLGESIMPRSQGLLRSTRVMRLLSHRFMDAGSWHQGGVANMMACRLADILDRVLLRVRLYGRTFVECKLSILLRYINF